MTLVVSLLGLLRLCRGVERKPLQRSVFGRHDLRIFDCRFNSPGPCLDPAGFFTGCAVGCLFETAGL